MKRNCRFELRLSKEELAVLTRKARKAGLSGAGLLRRAIYDLEVKEAPAADAAALLWELRRVGRGLDQLLKTANARALPEEPELRRALEENRAAARLVVAAYALDG